MAVTVTHTEESLTGQNLLRNPKNQAPDLSRTGTVFNIQRFSIHDGPGIRTTVFLKGCSLRCFWCHNPEGLHVNLEIQFTPSRCIGCGECVRACPDGAQELLADGTRMYHRDRCDLCGKCLDVCFSGGLQQVGKEMTSEEVMAEVRRDIAFYETSGGGITLSGGEPLIQPQFALAILAQAKAEGIHTAIETTSNVHWEVIESIFPVTDLVMMDIKHMDSARHREVTGVPNERILANARRLAESGKPVLFRTPVVPTVNDTPEEIGAIAAYIASIKSTRPGSTPPPGSAVHASRPVENPDLELLPFHRMAGDKYRSLGMDYLAAPLETPSKEKMLSLAEAATAAGITVRVR